MPQEFDVGAYVPTTDVFDTEAIYSLDINSQEFKEFLVRLRQSVNNMALVVNIKDSGFYDTTEFVNSQSYFATNAVGDPQYLRPVFRKVINFGALPNTATKSVAHGITVDANTSFTRIYATATKPTATFTYIPIPYASPTDSENIELYVDDTNVNIETGSDRTAFTICYVVLEYLKS